LSSSAGPSRVSRPRRSSAATSNGSTASSTGTAEGARTAGSGEIPGAGDCEVMALYLGSAGVNRNPRSGPKSPLSSPRRRGPITTVLAAHERQLQRLIPIENPGRMGPRLRGDDKIMSRHLVKTPGQNALLR